MIVLIAEVDATSGRQAEISLAREWGDRRVHFIATDVGDEQSIRSLVEAAQARFGKVDVMLNNATYSPVGMAVTEIPIEMWDRSYAVNIRGPASLARACLPQMIGRLHGVFVCLSSTGGPYLAAYETLKAAQLALANTLDGELEGSGVIAFTIGPGLSGQPAEMPSPTTVGAPLECSRCSSGAALATRTTMPSGPQDLVRWGPSTLAVIHDHALN